MKPIKTEEILKATKGILINGKQDSLINNISTDTRKIVKGALFIPLKGEIYDGHSYIKEAFKAGAGGCLTENEINFNYDDYKYVSIIKVKNTLKALQDIAYYYREKFKIPYIAITGSVGKTTTKDMIAHLLSQKYTILKTPGNYNNEIGLPLTLLGLNQKHQMAVMELGMSGFNEIKKLVKIVKPDIAVITNIGMSHIEKLGSKQNILKAKMEIFEGLNKTGLAILNGDDDLLFTLKDDLPFKTIFFGIHNEDVQFRARNILNKGDKGVEFKINIGNKENIIKIPVMGEHNIYNTLAAIIIGLEYGLEMDIITKALSSFQPSEMRLNIIEYNGIRVINDCYNASPSSMEAALKVLSSIKGDKLRKIAILGDMLEIGQWSLESHKKVGKIVMEENIDNLITVGNYAKYIALGAIENGMDKNKVCSFKDTEEVIKFLKHFLKYEKGVNDLILIKASRGMKLEKITDYLLEGR